MKEGLVIISILLIYYIVSITIELIKNRNITGFRIKLNKFNNEEEGKEYTKEIK